MPLQFDVLEDAVRALRESIRVTTNQPDSTEPALRRTLESGVIQHFKIAYEQSWKFVRRWIREFASEEAEYFRTRRDLFRLAARYQLVSDPAVWFEYGEARNLTAHTYNRKQAEIVYRMALRFLSDAEELLTRMKSRTEDDQS